jgi:hypothetical protein
MGEKWTRCQLRSLKIVFQSTHGIAFSDDPDRVSESILSNYSQNTARSGANMFCLYQGLSGGTEFAVAAQLDPLAAFVERGDLVRARVEAVGENAQDLAAFDAQANLAHHSPDFEMRFSSLGVAARPIATISGNNGVLCYAPLT